MCLLWHAYGVALMCFAVMGVCVRLRVFRGMCVACRACFGVHGVYYVWRAMCVSCVWCCSSVLCNNVLQCAGYDCMSSVSCVLCVVPLAWCVVCSICGVTNVSWVACMWCGSSVLCGGVLWHVRYVHECSMVFVIVPLAGCCV